MHPQLPLGLESGERFNFDTFVEGENALVASILRQCARDEGEQQIFLWGENGRGKSHLLQAACHLAAKHQRTVCYFTSQQMLMRTPVIFEGLEQLHLICLDELEIWLNNTHWQEALFDLINRVRETGNNLIMSSVHSPEASKIVLADLRSRLSWGPVFQLKALVDDEKVKAMQIRARQSGLALTENVAGYLLTRYPRDLSDQFRRLEILDKVAMSMQRSLTIPLIREVFPEE